MGHFLLGLFKDRAVAMGKPHCNRSIRTFLVIKIVRDFILVLPSVANASAASVLFRVSASAFSVRFRVLPWLIFLLFLILWLNPAIVLNRSGF